MNIQKTLDGVKLATSPLNKKFTVYAAIGKQKENFFDADYKKDITQDFIRVILDQLKNGDSSLIISSDKGIKGELRFIKHEL